jgi:O-antigen/teichoic acid export membrane protein
LRGSGPPSRHVTWNLAAFGILAASGFLANLLIARVYGPSTAGLFNQVFALYIGFSQLGAFGIHLAALRAASLLGEPERSGPELGALLGAAVLSTAATATLTTAAAFASSFFLDGLFRSPALPAAWRLALPGLWCFALNKVLIAMCNGAGHMRLFVVAQAARPVLFLLACIAWAAFGLSGERLALALTLAEVGLTLGLAAVLLALARPLQLRRGTVGPLLSFAVRALPSALFGELNTRIDVLVLGLFVSDAEIGIYTLAAWLIEGISQISVSLRPVLNRSLAQFLAAGDVAGLRRLFIRFGRLAAASTGGLVAALWLTYPTLTVTVLHQPGFIAGRLAFTVLGAGLLLASFELPFDLLLVQSGRPVAQSRLKMALCAVNAVLGLLLTPRYGILGGAIGYAASFVLYAVWLRREMMAVLTADLRLAR